VVAPSSPRHRGGIGILLALPILIPSRTSPRSPTSVTTPRDRRDAHISIHAVQMFFDPYVHARSSRISTWRVSGVGSVGTSRRASERSRCSDSSARAFDPFASISPPGRSSDSVRVNFLELRKVWNLIPLIENVSFGRYIMSSCELSFILLRPSVSWTSPRAPGEATLHGDDLGDAPRAHLDRAGVEFAQQGHHLRTPRALHLRLPRRDPFIAIIACSSLDY